MNILKNLLKFSKCPLGITGVSTDVNLKKSSQLSQNKEYSDAGHMSQMVSAMGAMILSNKEASHFSAPSVNDPAQTASSIGYQFTSEEVGSRDENVSMLSSHQLDTKSIQKSDDVNREVIVQSSANAAGQVIRRGSTTEFIYNLLTEDTAPEVVPLYSSWSLLCLGPANLYNPQKGTSLGYLIYFCCTNLHIFLQKY